MIDLHLHTYYSDGTLSPNEVVRRAASRGVMTIAITDHDGIGGIPEALEAGEAYGVKVIPGIEFSTKMSAKELKQPVEVSSEPDIHMHLLGHDIDIRNAALNLAVDTIRKQREERNRKLLEAFHRIGFPIEESDLVQNSQKGYLGKPNFAIALMRRGYIKTPKEAFASGQYLHHPEVKKVHREKIHVREAIALIRQAGGQAVLAHPLKIKFLHESGAQPYQRLEVLLDSLEEWGLTGLECHYSTHTPEQAAKLAQIAARRGLLATSGSDFHGPDFNPNLDVGVVVDLNRSQISQSSL